MITEKDLIGQLKGFPIQVVEKMLERQVQQGNIEDVTVFQKNCSAGKQKGGFTWNLAPEGSDFWALVISCEEFNTFFQLYPKLSNKIWIRGNEDRSEEIINELIKRGGIKNLEHSIIHNHLGYAIDPVTKQIFSFSPNAYIITSEYTEITLPEPALEVTMEEVAKKFGVSQIKIKNK